jgi:hypothetical protein
VARESKARLLGKLRGTTRADSHVAGPDASTPADGMEIMDPQDYPEIPPLNRKCHEDNIHQTILAALYIMWVREEYLDLYFRVYQSISNRFIQKIARKGLKDANNNKYDEENIVQTSTSYLPSGLPVDRDGMQKLADGLVERRRRRRKEEEAHNKAMELGQCLICRGIETVLQTSEMK